MRLEKRRPSMMNGLVLKPLFLEDPWAPKCCSRNGSSLGKAVWRRALQWAACCAEWSNWPLPLYGKQLPAFPLIGNGSIRPLAQRRRGLRPERGNPRPPPKHRVSGGPEMRLGKRRPSMMNGLVLKPLFSDGHGAPKCGLENGSSLGRTV